MPIAYALHPYNQLLYSLKTFDDFKLQQQVHNKSQISWNEIRSLRKWQSLLWWWWLQMIIIDVGLVWRKAIFHFVWQFNRFSAHCCVRAIYVCLQCVYLKRYIGFASSYAYDTYHILILFNATWLFSRLIGKKYIWFYQTYSTVPCEKDSSSSQSVNHHGLKYEE